VKQTIKIKVFENFIWLDEKDFLLTKVYSYKNCEFFQSVTKVIQFVARRKKERFIKFELFD